ncbi:unnamed protein product [Linum tenue]|uniref:RING-CH-type domain-containing protein n=1 Tax=Linum tenue TaxID=586396 RepID=A0AAV0Q5Y8_9ROSI|nr:unnamed protein product [Linum tenue]
MQTLSSTQLEREREHHFSRSSSDLSFGEIGAHRNSTASDGISDLDLESGELELKVHSADHNNDKAAAARDCRICHLGLLSNEHESGVAIQLGCCCKGDLAAAHKKCAETWFKIKGNLICEICGAAAVNVAGELTNMAFNANAAASVPATAPVVLVEARPAWHSRRIMNFLLACMVLAFVVSWLFHFKILP